MPQLKPMLATDVADFSTIRYPVIGSPKIDGVRALMPEKILLPRSLKRFGNLATQEHFNFYANRLTGFDGELVVGPLNAPDMCRATSSALTSRKGDPSARWYIFDLVDIGYYFDQRVKLLKQRFKEFTKKELLEMRVELIEQRVIRNAAEAEAFEHEMLARGYEGVVWKNPNGLYKYGRGTPTDQCFLRTKRFEDAEAEIIGCTELLRNNNEAKTNELGHKTRSSHKENKAAGGVLGNFVCRVLNGPLKGAKFELGTGFDAVQRQQFWERRDEMIGKVVKFKYFAHGVKDKPRWPSFLGFRETFDM